MTDHYEREFHCPACLTRFMSILPQPRCWHCFGPMKPVPPEEVTSIVVHNRPKPGMVEITEHVNVFTAPVLHAVALEMENRALVEAKNNRRFGVGKSERKAAHDRNIRLAVYRMLAKEYKDRAYEAELGGL